MSQKNGEKYGTLSVGRMIIGLMSIKRAISLLLNFSASFLERRTEEDSYKGYLYF